MADHSTPLFIISCSLERMRDQCQRLQDSFDRLDQCLQDRTDSMDLGPWAHLQDYLSGRTPGLDPSYFRSRPVRLSQIPRLLHEWAIRREDGTLHLDHRILAITRRIRQITERPISRDEVREIMRREGWLSARHATFRLPVSEQRVA